MDNGDYDKDLMYDFWEKHSSKANEAEMMLDSKGFYISQVELPEIISILPDFSGKDLLELAAGIGRYTSVFAKDANKVVATDFINNFVKRNQEINGHLSNVNIYQADVTKMKCKENSFDFIFSNWLLMYLSDNDVVSLFENAIRWLRPGGYFFFRESCFHKSGDISRDSNPTIYRKPQQYLDLFKTIHFEENGRVFYFRLVLSKSIQCYIELKSNPNQICWLLCKEELKSQDEKNCESFLNCNFDFSSQSSDNDLFMQIDRAFYKDLFSKLEIQSNSKVLNVGCGTGNTSLLISELYGADVIGLDNTPELICLAQHKLNKLKIKGVQFMVQSYDELTLPNIFTFDFIVCNCLPALLNSSKNFVHKILDYLKNDGKLFLFNLCVDCESNKYEELECHLKNNRLYTQEHLKQILLSLNVKEIEEYFVNDKVINFFSQKDQILSIHDINEIAKETLKNQLKLLKDRNIKYCCYLITK